MIKPKYSQGNSVVLCRECMSRDRISGVFNVDCRVKKCDLLELAGKKQAGMLGASLTC